MPRKKVTIEVEFEVTEHDRLTVHKVTLDGTEVERTDARALYGNKEYYWPIVELEEDYLDLHLTRV